MKQTQRIVLNYIIFTFLFMGASLIIGKTAYESLTTETAGISEANPKEYVFVIDAGHGGEDGGAEVGGALEKDLNLAISENIADICTLFGTNVKLTRSDDRLLYDYYGSLDSYGKASPYT